MEQADLIWHNGELVAWEDAKVHVLSHGLHYGTGVFEGVRAYETVNGTAIFRHQEHVARLFRSAELYYMPLPYTAEELRQAAHELLIANGLRECYIRPIAFRGYGVMGLYPLEAPVDVSIAAWPWGAYLGEESKQIGIRAKVASWRRMNGDSFVPESKATGQYLNSILAKIEATKAGYEEAILLDQRGFVGEGSGENIFLVNDDTLHTPSLAGGILDGITRNSVIRIARDLGYESRRARSHSDRAVPGRRGVRHGHRRRGRGYPRGRRSPRRRAAARGPVTAEVAARVRGRDPWSRAALRGMARSRRSARTHRLRAR